MHIFGLNILFQKKFDQARQKYTLSPIHNHVHVYPYVPTQSPELRSKWLSVLTTLGLSALLGDL